MRMLGRTAQNLFWLSRYVERAENMARLLEVGYRMSLTSRREGGSSEHLVSMLRAAEMDKLFDERHDVADVDTVAHFMMFDAANPSSVYSCLQAARTNARSVRTAITTDMWESMNGAWLEFSQIRPADVRGAKLLGLLQWVRQRSHEFRGALLGTILRDDGFAFLQAGNFVERADNTARILDMKYFVLLPGSTSVGGEIDIQQWTLILRAASAHRAYGHVYHDRYRSDYIADFLILRPEMPRSLIYCAKFIEQNLNDLARFYGRREDCHEATADLLALVEGSSMEDIFADGLHEFLSEFIERNDRVTASLTQSYNFF
jgi:uncharacterized alpha-E superfamily protein